MCYAEPMAPSPVHAPRSPWPPQTLLAALTAFGLASAVLVTALAARLPAPEVTFSVEGDEIVIDETPPALAALRGRRVTAFVGGSGARLEAAPELLLEEPDVLPTYAAIDEFVAAQGELATALARGGIAVELDDGARMWIPASPRGVFGVPLGFFMQLGFGLVGLVLGGAIWAFRPTSIPTRLYAITGAGFAMAAFSAAVYSTRGLAIDPALYGLLAATNMFGTEAFAGALLGLLWSYPAPLRRWPVPLAALLVALAFWVMAVLEVGDKSWTGPQTGVFVLFLPCFPVAYAQWRKHATSPVDRAALQWFFLSIFSGTVLFAALVLAPPLVGARPLAEQSSMLGVFLLVYAGIAAALTRYRLFDIERWWFGALAWFLGGLAIVLVDALLLMTLPMAGVTATFAAVAIVGWLYFPVRQWLWRRLFRRREGHFGELIRSFVARLASQRSSQSFRDIWPEMLEEAFQPLEIEPLEGSVSRLRIGAHGQSLELPGSPHFPAFRLTHPRRGTRLFSRGDLELAEALRSLVAHGASAVAERERGIEDERQRIMRDLHDDLGGKLLAMTHKGTTETQELARAALQDVGDVLAALEAGPTTLLALVEQCRWELQTRAESHGLSVELDASRVADDRPLTAREATNLTRILREAVTNAIRHAHARSIRVVVRHAPPVLDLEVRNDGVFDDPSTWRTGRGRKTMKLRARDLSGDVGWHVDGDECVVSARVRLGDSRAAGPRAGGAERVSRARLGEEETG